MSRRLLFNARDVHQISTVVTYFVIQRNSAGRIFYFLEFY